MRLLGLSSSPNKQTSQVFGFVSAVLEGGKSEGAEVKFVEKIQGNNT